MLVVTNDQQRKQRGMRTKEIIDSKDVLLLPRVSGSVSHFFFIFINFWQGKIFRPLVDFGYISSANNCV